MGSVVGGGSSSAAGVGGGVWRGERVRRGRRTALASALSGAPSLVAAVELAVGSGPIPLSGEPAAPAASGVLTGWATVAGLGSPGQEPAFTSLEQAAAAGGMPAVRTGGLTRHQGVGRLGTAHGRACSRAVRRRGGGASRRHSAPTAGMARVGDRAARTRQISCRDSCLPRREREGASQSRDQPIAALAQLAPRKWLAVRPLLTRILDCFRYFGDLNGRSWCLPGSQPRAPQRASVGSTNGTSFTSQSEHWRTNRRNLGPDHYVMKPRPRAV